MLQKFRFAKKPLAVTLVELMVALSIAAIVLAIGANTLGGYRAKGRIRQSLQNVESLLRKAQIEAQQRSLWTCVTFSSSGAGSIYIDKDGNHGASTTACGNGDDPLVLELPSALRPPVTLAACDGNVDFACFIWIDTQGKAKLCSNSGNCGQEILPLPGGGANCVDWDYQIILTTPQLDGNARARELEFTRSGLIILPPLGQKGQVESLWAKIPPIHEEAGACE